MEEDVKSIEILNKDVFERLNRMKEAKLTQEKKLDASIMHQLEARRVQDIKMKILERKIATLEEMVVILSRRKETAGRCRCVIS